MMKFVVVRNKHVITEIIADDLPHKHDVLLFDDNEYIVVNVIHRYSRVEGKLTNVQEPIVQVNHVRRVPS